jgi:hypothetical protein
MDAQAAMHGETDQQAENAQASVERRRPRSPWRDFNLLTEEELREKDRRLAMSG